MKNTIPVKQFNKTKKKPSESQVQVALSAYVRGNYPDVVFTAESSGVKMTIGAAVKLKSQRSVGKLPDFIMLEPRGGFAGLVIELKKEGESPYLKDGITLKSNEHIAGQADMLNRLREKGYMSRFAVGYAEAKLLVDCYMKYELNFK